MHSTTDRNVVPSIPSRVKFLFSAQEFSASLKRSLNSSANKYYYHQSLIVGALIGVPRGCLHEKLVWIACMRSLYVVGMGCLHEKLVWIGLLACVYMHMHLRCLYPFRCLHASTSIYNGREHQRPSSCSFFCVCVSPSTVVFVHQRRWTLGVSNSNYAIAKCMMLVLFPGMHDAGVVFMQ
jgi:hypothetical protein